MTLLNNLDELSDEALRILCYDTPGLQTVYDRLRPEMARGQLLRQIRRQVDHNVIHNLPQAPPEAAEAAADSEAVPLPACPYRGLFAFRPEDAPFFFGRETFTRQLVRAAETRNLAAVLGASGSGKSSVVFAGLVPALQATGRWRFTFFRPGHDPFFNLAGALVPLIAPDLNKIERIGAARDVAGRLQGGQSPLTDYAQEIYEAQPDHQLLIVADQFEELYTLCREEAVRRRFLDLLLDALEADQAAAPRLVLTLRVDFLGQALAYRPLADALQGTDLKLGPMTRAELIEAIEKPAAEQGVSFEENLVEHILTDVGQAEGNLPLLEFALTELWQHQTGGVLTYAAYEALGGAKGALSRHADQVYRRLTPVEQDQARRVLVQLVNPGAGTEDTRRLARRTELEADWPLVAKLASERLVVTNQLQDEQETAEVVHEALIRHWGQLQAWMTKDRAFRAWQEGLRLALRQWEQADQDDDALLRGRFLDEAQERLAERPDDLSPPEQTFIRAGLALRAAAEAAQEAERERKLAAQRRRTFWIAMAGLAALLLAIAAGWFGLDATRQRVAAQATGTLIAHQNQVSQAESAFLQTTDPAMRVAHLATLFELEQDRLARRLFWQLSTQDERAALFVAEHEGLFVVSEGLYTTMADVQWTGYTAPLLMAMGEALDGITPRTAEIEILQAEITEWLEAQTLAREKRDDAPAAYESLLKAYGANPAIRYERAALLVALPDPDYPTALADLEQVLALVDPAATAQPGLIAGVVEFATADQVLWSVVRLIMLKPGLGQALRETGETYPHLGRAGLAPGPTPTPVTAPDGAKMVLVPAGPFTMGSNRGSDNEQPVHDVTLAAFYIDQYEVTNAQYRACVEAGGCAEAPGCSERYDDPDKVDHPVVCIDWHQARAYCEWRGDRLPTEAEWEKAARGTDGRTYPWGEIVVSDLGNYDYNSEDTTPVGSYLYGVSPYGVYDMAGNVWEWVQSEYRDYPYQADDGREDLDGRTNVRVLRGGGLGNSLDNARAAARRRLPRCSGRQLRGAVCGWRPRLIFWVAGFWASGGSLRGEPPQSRAKRGRVAGKG